MSLDQRLSELAAFTQRRITERLLALQRAQELETFIASLGKDSAPGSFMHQAIITGEVQPFIDAWRRQVDEVIRDAVAIGDSDLKKFTETLKAWREPVAQALGHTDWTAGEPSPNATPPSGPPLYGTLEEICARLEVLVGQARRRATLAWVLAILVAVTLAWSARGLWTG